jgi:hypothetical protein
MLHNNRAEACGTKTHKINDVFLSAEGEVMPRVRPQSLVHVGVENVPEDWLARVRAGVTVRATCQ